MICPGCGANIPDGAIFCTGCGTMIDSQAPAQPSDVQMPGGYQAAQPTASQYQQPMAQQPMAPQPQYQQPAQQPMMPQSVQPTPASQQASFAGAASQSAPAQPYGQPVVAQPAAPMAAAAGAAAAQQASAKKPMKPIVYGLIAGVAVIALIVGAVFFSSSGGGSSDNGGDTGGTPTDTIDSTDGGDDTVSSSSTQAEYKGVHFTVPAGWEESELDDGVDYTLYGDGYWVDCMVYSVGSSEGFDAESWNEDKTEWYGYMENTEVVNAKTTTIDGYPTAYMEVVSHYDDMDDGYEMLIVMDTPSGELIQMSGTCNNDNQEAKDQLHAIADTISIS